MAPPWYEQLLERVREAPQLVAMVGGLVVVVVLARISSDAWGASTPEGVVSERLARESRQLYGRAMQAGGAIYQWQDLVGAQLRLRLARELARSDGALEAKTSLDVQRTAKAIDEALEQASQRLEHKLAKASASSTTTVARRKS